MQGLKYDSITTVLKVAMSQNILNWNLVPVVPKVPSLSVPLAVLTKIGEAHQPITYTEASSAYTCITQLQMTENSSIENVS